MPPVVRVQDSVHGLMEFAGMESLVVELLRAGELQRLRRIRQMGLAHMVFPGAEHSRLVHSLGAAFLATRFARSLSAGTEAFLTDFLRPDESATRDLAIAALCHDLGHGPLSHVWEAHVIGDHFDREAWATTLGVALSPTDLGRLKWHEIVGQALLVWSDGELHRLLERQEAGFSRRISEMLLGRYYLPYLPRLLSSDVDLDRCDFLLRDAHQTGVRYGQFDVDWLISTASVGSTADGKLVCGFDLRKAPPVIEQFLVARRAMYNTVYHHKTVRAAETMVGLFLRRMTQVRAGEKAAQARTRNPFEPFDKVIRGETLSPPEVLALDDYSLWVFIQSVADGDGDATASDLARRIIGRDLLKTVPCTPERLSAFITRPDAYAQVYEAVRPYCRGDPQHYVSFDNAPFEMLSENEGSSAYFVDVDSPRRAPSRIRDHERIRPYDGPQYGAARLFVPREAIADVLRLIERP